ncbi:MAG: hypothetical protein AAB421_01345 [Patescibacteria group bacterium]
MDASVGSFAAFAPLFWILLALAVLVSAIFGLILSYHWIRFAASPLVAFFSIVTYAIGCVVLVAIMLFSLITIL